MKKFFAAILFLILLVLPHNAFAQKDLQQQYERAAALYANREYAAAADLYAQLLECGVSADLYYNYANALLKSDQIGKAVLNYERALRLKPNFEEARYNLEYANLQKTDKIEAIEPFFLVLWGRAITRLFEPNVWAYISIAFFVLMLVMTLIYLFSKALTLRKVAFSVAFVALCFSITAFAFAFSAKESMLNNNEAIVVVGSVTVKSTPDEGGTEVFVIHEGTKVVITQRLNEWCEVKLADGNVGWLKESVIEVI